MIGAQFETREESRNDFKDAFSRIVGETPILRGQSHVFRASLVDTRLGCMVAVADEETLYLLEFVNRRGLERKIERLKQKTHSVIIPGVTEAICSIERELNHYFEGQLQEFKTPLFLLGSPFQKRVWEELQKISPGETRSYAQIAASIGKPSAFRAVANANGANPIALVIPCHRVINTNGDLGGYAGGLARKEWLLQHEKQEMHS